VSGKILTATAPYLHRRSNNYETSTLILFGRDTFGEMGRHLHSGSNCKVLKSLRAVLARLISHANFLPLNWNTDDLCANNGAIQTGQECFLHPGWHGTKDTKSWANSGPPDMHKTRSSTEYSVLNIEAICRLNAVAPAPG
jgi:hypothetical protein